MENPRKSICSGDIYFTNNTQDMVTQAGYQQSGRRGAAERQHGSKRGRPPVPAVLTL